MFRNFFKKEKEAMKAIEKEAKEANRLESLRDNFFNILFMIGYARGKKRTELIKKAKKIADKIPELKGWPSNMEKFWNVESFGWDKRIPEEIRKLIKKELRKRAKGKSVELGSGSYPYLSKSSLVDLSKDMLENAPKGHKKVNADLNKELPFADNSFDCASAVFVVDYLSDLRKTLKEVKRILNKKGRFFIVQSKRPISNYYHKHEKKFWKTVELSKILKSNNFSVKINEFKVGVHELVLIEAKCL